MKLPQRGRRGAISALQNVIAKTNRFAADVTIIFIKNPRDSLAFTATSANLYILQKTLVGTHECKFYTVSAKNMETVFLVG